MATPAGEGGIGIVRISGPDAAAIGDELFRGRAPGRLSGCGPFRLRLGEVVDPRTGERLDEVLAVWMPEGRSYTGEPTVEIHAHGGPAILDAILEACLARGARLARPGEFTRRAYLCGRLDLSQAEAVAALVAARSGAERREALAHLGGALGGRVRGLRDLVLDLAAAAEVLIDLADEDSPGHSFPAGQLSAAARQARALAGEGRAAGEDDREPRIVIAGRVNSGKSSIFNKLLMMERSIVAPVPGTTRDFVEQRVWIDGSLVVLVDTAGVRETGDQVEAEGVRRSMELVERARVVVLVVDGSTPMAPEDLALVGALARRNPILVASKADLPERCDRAELAGGLPVIRTSVVTGEGLRELRAEIGSRCRSGPEEGRAARAAPNARQREALDRAASSLEVACEGLRSGGMAIDLVAEELRNSLAAIGEVTGEGASEELLERVFSRFCIGK